MRPAFASKVRVPRKPELLPLKATIPGLTRLVPKVCGTPVAAACEAVTVAPEFITVERMSMVLEASPEMLEAMVNVAPGSVDWEVRLVLIPPEMASSTSVVPYVMLLVALAVATAERVMCVASTMEAIVVPAVMPVPETICPACK